MNWQVNVAGTKNIADAAKQYGAKLVAVSTDYVFDGLNMVSIAKQIQLIQETLMGAPS